MSVFLEENKELNNKMINLEIKPRAIEQNENINNVVTAGINEPENRCEV